jgi:hypothetical protein
MIEFDQKLGSEIPPEDSRIKIPEEEEVKKFFENFFKKNVDEFLIYKKNQFKNPNKEVMNDFINKFEGFIKGENKNADLDNFINIVFKSINNNIKMLEDRKCIPDNKKILAFFTSFIISKFFS